MGGEKESMCHKQCGRYGTRREEGEDKQFRGRATGQPQQWMGAEGTVGGRIWGRGRFKFVEERTYEKGRAGNRQANKQEKLGVDCMYGWQGKAVFLVHRGITEAIGQDPSRS